MKSNYIYLTVSDQNFLKAFVKNGKHAVTFTADNVYGYIDDDGLDFYNAAYLLSDDASNNPELKELEQLILDWNVEKAIEKAKLLAEAGNARAMGYLGWIYWGIAEDESLAKKWTRKGYRAGDPISAVVYALTLDDDELSDILDEVADEIMQLAQAGNFMAQYIMFYVCLKQLDRNEDDEAETDDLIMKEAAPWLKKSASQGYVVAQFMLAEICYADDEDYYDEAVKWYRKAAEKGYEDAQDALDELGETY